tara:strand:+ start:907 stop:1833 length:927 start_codon:yes stop_codon:yes gene_type:complete
MGIKLLSKLLKQECEDVTKQLHLSQLYGKKLCIDASIYMYRFKSNDSLLESLYLMCSLFRTYNIDVIFVFDGKPGDEKQVEIQQRREDRRNKWILYDELIKKGNLTEQDQKQLYKLKRTLTKIKQEDVEKTKQLLDYYGIKHIQAIGEADKLCASLVIKKKVYAVLSEDMDLFAYGSLNVIRYLSLVNHTCIIYNYKKILNKLNMNTNEFKLLCTLSGNDYLKNNKNIFYYFILHQKFKKKKKDISWLKWLVENDHLQDIEMDDIIKTINLYTINVTELSKYKYFIIKNTRYDKDGILDLLKQERFII